LTPLAVIAFCGMLLLCGTTSFPLPVPMPGVEEMEKKAQVIAVGEVRSLREGIADEQNRSLFRSMRGRSRELTTRAMSRFDAYKMIQRRTEDAGIASQIACPTFRATGITEYLRNGGPIEHAQAIAAHESPRTTKLYDRTSDAISLDEIERIVI